MSDATLKTPAVPHDGTDAEARPIYREDRKILGISTEAWPGIIAPIVVGIIALGGWEAIVRWREIPPFILPGPLLIAQTLVADWSSLSSSLWVTLQITAAALFAAVTAGRQVDYDRDLPQRVLGEFFAARGVAYLDLLPELRRAEVAGHTYVPRDTHWNEHGHAVAAAAIAAWID